MVTWKEAEPPKLAPVGWGAKLIGGVRIAVVVVMTLVCLALFLLGKGAKRLFGDRVRFHYLVARLWSRAVLALLGVRRRVRGAPIQKGGVLTANHASWLDIISMRSVTRINFVSKAEVRDWPGVGLIADICETVFIERKRTAAKRQQVELEGRMRRDELLCIFPEGTSTDGLRVLPFKSTLLSVLFLDGVRERALVQPVSVIYRVNARSALPPNFYGWWGSMSFESHIWAVATRSHGGEVEVVFHEPMRVADWDDRKALAARCEADVRSAFPEDAPVEMRLGDGAA